MEVIWKPIPEDPRYSANEEGYIRNNATGRITKGYKKRSKTFYYLYVKLGKYGKERQVHQLVLEAFGYPKPGENYQVDHHNANTLDNRLCNISWVTPSENNLNPLRIMTRGKRVYQLTPDNKFVKRFLSSGDAARELGVEEGDSNIRRAERNNYEAFGYKWLPESECPELWKMMRRVKCFEETGCIF